MTEIRMLSGRDTNKEPYWFRWKYTLYMIIYWLCYNNKRSNKLKKNTNKMCL